MKNVIKRFRFDQDFIFIKTQYMREFFTAVINVNIGNKLVWLNFVLIIFQPIIPLKNKLELTLVVIPFNKVVLGRF